MRSSRKSVSASQLQCAGGRGPTTCQAHSYGALVCPAPDGLGVLVQLPSLFGLKPGGVLVRGFPKNSHTPMCCECCMSPPFCFERVVLVQQLGLRRVAHDRTSNSEVVIPHFNLSGCIVASCKGIQGCRNWRGFLQTCQVATLQDEPPSQNLFSFRLKFMAVVRSNAPPCAAVSRPVQYPCACGWPTGRACSVGLKASLKRKPNSSI